MKLPYFVHVSYLALIFSVISVSCKDNSNFKLSSQSEKENLFFSPNLRVGTIHDSTLDKSFFKILNDQTFILKGTYHNCNGKVDGDIWNLTRSKETTTLLIKKNDSKCKLNVTGFSLTKIGEVNAIASYQSAQPGHQLTETFLQEGKHFYLETNTLGVPEVLYLRLNMTPIDFISNPIITIILSDLDNKVDLDKDKIKYRESVIYTPTGVSITHIKAPDYTATEDEFTIFSDTDSSNTNINNTLYEGHYTFASTHTKATSYLIVKGDMDTSDYIKVDNEFKSKKNKINKIDTKLSNIKINGASLAKDAELPGKLLVGDTVKAKIIFANTDVNGISSYQLFTIEIKRK